MTAPKRPEKPKRDAFGLTEGNYRAIIIAVSTIWVASNLFGMVAAAFKLDVNFDPTGQVNTIFLTVITGAFIGRTRMNGGGKDDES